MIQPQELRLGNLIMEPYDNMVEVVDSIRDNEVNGEPTDYFNPIPLTEEWLIKLGFHEIFGVYAVYGREINLKLMDGYWDVYFKGKHVSVIKHVHQLQNLYFALTGQELTLK